MLHVIFLKHFELLLLSSLVHRKILSSFIFQFFVNFLSFLFFLGILRNIDVANKYDVFR